MHTEYEVRVLDIDTEKIILKLEALGAEKIAEFDYKRRVYNFHPAVDHKWIRLRTAIEEYIKNKNDNLVGSMESQGTTPRRLTDLIGSLCDLTSGSGDKGTPVVFIQGYFDNYTNV
jgi:hypothetical protein